MSQSKVPFAALLLAVAGTVASAAQIVPTPRAAPLRSSAVNRPFLEARSALQPVDLAARGYVEQEFLLSGLAAIYDWSAAGARPAAVARTRNVPYTTRLLVRRPADRARFSGRVVLELLDPTRLHEAAPLWGLSHEHFLRSGDAWVGLTVKPAAAATLQKFDAVRYANLGFAFAQAADCRPGADAGAGAGAFDASKSEDGLAWDVIAQAGALLRSSSKENPLAPLDVRRIVAAGHAQAGDYLITFVNALHDELRLGDGRPVFDGYLQAAGGAKPVPVNQCAAPLAADDARLRIGPRDAPFVTVLTQTDVPRAQHLRRADADGEDDFHRLYEIAGAAHAGPYPAGLPNAADLRIAGFEPEAADACAEPRSDFPAGPAFNAIWQQLDELLVAGTPMARAEPLQLDASGAVATDAAGNARGGLRLPAVDVPLAVWAGRSTPRAADDAPAASRCGLTGSMRRLGGAELKALHGSRAEFLRRFDAAVDAAVQARWVVPADAAAMKAAAARAAPTF